MSPLQIAFLINTILSFLIILDMIFIRKKKIERILAWVLFLMIPFVGLFFYVALGSGLDRFNKKNIKKMKLWSKDYRNYVKRQTKFIQDPETEYPEDIKEMILFNLKNADSLYSSKNSVKYFCDGSSALNSLIHDIRRAKSSIHIEFYIFANDKTARRLKQVLLEKAKEGVEVRVLYDAVGSIGTSRRHFRKLRKAGGMVSEFLPPILNMTFLNINANYRNHRKICVIDGKIGYTGGFNIRDDHMGLSKKLTPWRDTTVRVVGPAVASFQNIFLSDWRFSTKDKEPLSNYFTPKYFPKANKAGNVAMQVIKSGPDSGKEEIKDCLIKMIVSAKKYVKIQTPYFVPDDAFFEAVKLALLSGVSVELMIPEQIDHYLVHFANFSYVEDLIPFGLKVYLYKGFIHSKVLLVDDKIISVGSCNLDIRSFALNFETNVVMYSEQETKKYSKIFDLDIKKCKVYDKLESKKTNLFFKIATRLCRLFSAVL